MPRNPTASALTLLITFNFTGSYKPRVLPAPEYTSLMVKKNEGACVQLLSDRSQNHQTEVRNLFIHHLVHY